MLGALFAPPTARAGEYCSRDNDNATDCSFTSMEQCEATRSGIGGDCYASASLQDNNIASIKRSAYAYSPRPSHGTRVRRRLAAHTNN